MDELWSTIFPELVKHLENHIEHGKSNGSCRIETSVVAFQKVFKKATVFLIKKQWVDFVDARFTSWWTGLSSTVLTATS
jgi:hypothetical protein